MEARTFICIRMQLPCEWFASKLDLDGCQKWPNQSCRASCLIRVKRGGGGGSAENPL